MLKIPPPILKAIEADLDKWRHPCSQMGRLNIVKVVFPQLIYGVNAIAIKIPAAFSLKLTNNPKIHTKQE